MTHTREAPRDAATAKMREVLATLNDAVTDAGNDILVASNASREPGTDSRMPALFKALRKREGERDHARNLLNAMEAGQ